MRRPVDMLILVEHVARELDVACALASRLSRQHGLDVAVDSLLPRLRSLARQYEPRMVVLPYCYSAGDFAVRDIVPAWPQAVYANLAYEQVYHRLNQGFKTPKDDFARRRVVHFAWGGFFRDYLVGHGVLPENVVVTGNPTLGLYQSPYCRYFEPRAVLAGRHGLDERRRWVFFPENYAAAFYTDALLKDYIRRGYSPRDALQFRDFAAASFAEVARWLRQAAQAGSVEVIVRPRPATPVGELIAAYERAAGGIPPHLHFIKEGTVREWILASDTVVSSYSTTLIEAAVAGKPSYLLMPSPFPDFLHAEWYRFVPALRSAEAFLGILRSGPSAEAGLELKAWTQRTLLGQADPISGQADALAALQRRKPAAGVGHRRVFGWMRLPTKDRLWRNNRYYEHDLFGQAEVDRRMVRWGQVLGSDGSKPRLSVVICAWTAATDLEGVVSHFERQTAEPGCFEVIIVDNSPAGVLRAAVEAASRRTAVTVRYAREPQLGLSAARNRGIGEARGEIVAFVDDDARVFPDWVQNLLAAYDALPQAAAVGGSIVLQWPSGLPAWWKASFNELCGELDYGGCRVVVGYPRYPYGGNISFRVEALMQSGGFSRQLGPVGGRQLDGEEQELCLRIERAGGSVFFDPAVRVTHVVPAGRLCRKFVAQKAFHHGRTMAMIEAGHFGRRFALWRICQLQGSPIRRRKKAQSLPDASSWPRVPAVESWLSQDLSCPRSRGLTFRVWAQGLGYATQLFGCELWGLKPTLRLTQSS